MAWQNRLDAFAAERGWGPYLNPKNIAMALSVEAAELVELYQWASPEEAAAAAKIAKNALKYPVPKG